MYTIYNMYIYIYSTILGSVMPLQGPATPFIEDGIRDSERLRPVVSVCVSLGGFVCHNAYLVLLPSLSGQLCLLP